MPFKTGVEIKNDTVSVDYAHQILRPFVHFDNCVVIFITAKRCSQALMNYIKQFKDKWHLYIEVIENEELAKLLKANNLLK
jgi:hypothetical protein